MGVLQRKTEGNSSLCQTSAIVKWWMHTATRRSPLLGISACSQSREKKFRKCRPPIEAPIESIHHTTSSTTHMVPHNHHTARSNCCVSASITSWTPAKSSCESSAALSWSQRISRRFCKRSCWYLSGTKAHTLTVIPISTLAVLYTPCDVQTVNFVASPLRFLLNKLFPNCLERHVLGEWWSVSISLGIVNFVPPLLHPQELLCILCHVTNQTRSEDVHTHAEQTAAMCRTFFIWAITAMFICHTANHTTSLVNTRTPHIAASLNYALLLSHLLYALPVTPPAESHHHTHTHTTYTHSRAPV